MLGIVLKCCVCRADAEELLGCSARCSAGCGAFGLMHTPTSFGMFHVYTPTRLGMYHVLGCRAFGLACIPTCFDICHVSTPA